MVFWITMKTSPVSDDDGNGTPWKRWVEREGNQSPRWGRLVFSISPNMTCPLKIKAKETGDANGKRRSVLSLGRDELQPSAAALLRWHVDCPWFSRLLLGVGRESDGSPAYIQRRPQAQLTFSRLNVSEIKTHLSVLFFCFVPPLLSLMRSSCNLVFRAYPTITSCIWFEIYACNELKSRGSLQHFRAAKLHVFCISGKSCLSFAQALSLYIILMTEHVLLNKVHPFPAGKTSWNRLACFSWSSSLIMAGLRAGSTRVLTIPLAVQAWRPAKTSQLQAHLKD